MTAPSSRINACIATSPCGLFLNYRGKNKQLEIAAEIYSYIQDSL
jgi:hypothetical protein